MNDLISRQDAIDAVTKRIEISECGESVYHNKVIADIKSLPSADVVDRNECTKCVLYPFKQLRERLEANMVEVVQGEWIMLNPSLAKCSACGGYESTNGKDLTMEGIIFKEMKRYCPHCGARMDGAV